MRGHIYSDEEKEFLVGFSPGHSYKEITDAFNAKFGHDFSVKRISASMKRYGAKTGRTGRFEKDHVPSNKGKKMSPEQYEKCKVTMFKKGNLPKNHRPVGSERVNVDGYFEIKVSEPNKWILKHKYIWEQAYGPVPKDHIVIFLDGDPLNLQIDNLKLITKAENLYLNQHGLRFKDKNLTESATNVARVVQTINMRQREKKKAK